MASYAANAPGGAPPPADAGVASGQDPSAQQAPAAAPAAGRTSGSAVGDWHQWLTDPSNRSFFLQAGVDLMQPPSPGQNLIGQIGQAVGGGMAAQDRATQETFNNQAKMAELQRQSDEQKSTAELQRQQGQYYAQTGQSRADIAKLRALDPQTRSFAANASLYAKLLGQLELLTPGTEEYQSTMDLLQLAQRRMKAAPDAEPGGDITVENAPKDQLIQQAKAKLDAFPPDQRPAAKTAIIQKILGARRQDISQPELESALGGP